MARGCQSPLWSKMNKLLRHPSTFGVREPPKALCCQSPLSAPLLPQQSLRGPLLPQVSFTDTVYVVCLIMCSQPSPSRKVVLRNSLAAFCALAPMLARDHPFEPRGNKFIETELCTILEFVIYVGVFIGSAVLSPF